MTETGPDSRGIPQEWPQERETVSRASGKAKAGGRESHAKRLPGVDASLEQRLKIYRKFLLHTARDCEIAGWTGTEFMAIYKQERT